MAYPLNPPLCDNVMRWWFSDKAKGPYRPLQQAIAYTLAEATPCRIILQICKLQQSSHREPFVLSVCVIKAHCGRGCCMQTAIYSCYLLRQPSECLVVVDKNGFWKTIKLQPIRTQSWYYIMHLFNEQQQLKSATAMLNTHASCCHGVWYCETGRLHSTFIVCSYCRYKDLTVEIFVAAELSPASVVYRYQSDDLHARLRYDNRPRPISDYYNTVVYRVCTESYYE